MMATVVDADAARSEMLPLVLEMATDGVRLIDTVEATSHIHRRFSTDRATNYISTHCLFRFLTYDSMLPES